MSDASSTPVREPAGAEERPDAPAQDRSDELDLFAPPADDRNPAILDARKTYIITILSAVLFCGAVVVFLLL